MYWLVILFKFRVNTIKTFQPVLNMRDKMLILDDYRQWNILKERKRFLVYS